MSSEKIIDSVFDLPQLHAHPSAEELLNTLDYLALEPPSWDHHYQHHQSRNNEPEGGGGGESNVKVKINEVGVPSYLTSIVGSSLSWIDEDRREEILEAAGRRLSERCGRSAIPSISRTFIIPDPSSSSGSSISISLHEPSLTSDNLGHKTWLASYLLAKRLFLLRHHLLPPPPLHPFREPKLTKSKPPLLLSSSSSSSSGSSSSSSSSSSGIIASTTKDSEPFQILELGAGTGLVGIAAASVFPSANIHLTDLPAIVPNLRENVSRNLDIFSGENKKPDDDFDASRNVTVGVLDWSDLPSDLDVDNDHQVPRQQQQQQQQKYDLIIAADALYSPSHPAWLVNTINYFLKSTKQNQNARVIVEVPLRERYTPELQDFRTRMDERGFMLIEDGEEVGVEDWQATTKGTNEGDQQQQEVRCWWGVWRRGR